MNWFKIGQFFNSKEPEDTPQFAPQQTTPQQNQPQLPAAQPDVEVVDEIPQQNMAPAEPVQPLVPEAVNGTEGDIEKGETLGITYTTLIPILTKAIQEQEAKIKKQDELIKKLILRIESLEK